MAEKWNFDDDDEFIEENKEPEQKTPDKTPPAIEHPAYEELEEKLTLAEQRAQENLNKAARLQADLENQTKRAQKDLASAHKYNTEKIIVDLIPVKDSLEKALEAHELPNEVLNEVQKGVQLTLQMLSQLLAKNGVKTIDPKEGEAFNPAFHEAMTTAVVPNMEPNRIVKVLQTGYQLHDRLIRPARVIVSKAAIS